MLFGLGLAQHRFPTETGYKMTRGNMRAEPHDRVLTYGEVEAR
jgi:hypothetical protein